MLLDLRWSAGLATAVLVSAACTGTPAPVASGEVAWPETAPLASPSATGSAAAKHRRTVTSSHNEIARAATMPSAAPEAATRKLRDAAERLEEGLPVVDLWPPDQERIGYTDDEITLCLHAALNLAAAFGGTQEAAVQGIGAYWRWVNANGGIFDREVVLVQKDDRYQPETSRAAAEACKAERPFLFVGGPGYDQTDVIREWNERPGNRLPYFHWQASVDRGKRYSFSFEPPVEVLGRVSADWISARHAGRDIGIVWRNSGAFKVQRDELVARLRSKGVNIVADISVEFPQPNYTNEILRLKDAGAELVVLIANPLYEQDPFIGQAARQGFHPRWFLSVAINTSTEKWGKDETLEGVTSWPAYMKGSYSGPYKGYGAEVRRFERAMERYGGGPPIDLMWASWLDMKQIHLGLLACGPDCTRDEFVSLALSNRIPSAWPNCPVLFPEGSSVGTWSANIFSETLIDDKPAWQNARMCQRA